ncbi:Crp/Fnr family transcriptional regulator [bacterium]|nr:Crp/Fnr family transcriptional regulator [bacterium]
MICYYNKDGKRFIDEFSLDYEFITDYSSFLNQSPSNKNIQCIENTRLYVISRDSLDRLYEKNNAEFERLGRVMAEQLYMQWHEKSKSLLMDNATERYTKLIENRTQLPQRVPQYLIAEYLGITPESLSRIRKAIIPWSTPFLIIHQDGYSGSLIKGKEWCRQNSEKDGY